MRPSRTLRALLEGAIDYAGLFPPARLTMGDAVARYGAYLQSPHAWALGRLVVPAARLEELLSVRRTAGGSYRSWPLSAILDADSVGDAELIRQFNLRAEGFAYVDSLEVKAIDAANGLAHMVVAKAVAQSARLFYELPLGINTRSLVRTTREVHANAKVRTGGVTPESFPTANELAEFILACAEEGVAFKATAGLHHPCRGSYPLTYDEGAPSGRMFGFLNVLVAATVAKSGAGRNEIEEVLEVEEGSRFCFDDAGLAWRDVRVSRAQVERARSEFVLSFGSCSFEEPIQDLRRLSLL